MRRGYYYNIVYKEGQHDAVNGLPPTWPHLLNDKGWRRYYSDAYDSGYGNGLLWVRPPVDKLDWHKESPAMREISQTKEAK